MDAGADADAEIDAGPRAPYYTPCTSGTECNDLMCARGPDSTATVGQCSRTCGSDAECPSVGDATGVCIGGSCLQDCATVDRCPGAFGCYYDPTSQKRACFQIESSTWQGSQTCGTLQTQCSAPTECVSGGLLNLEGTCVVPCALEGTDCPFGGDCLAMPTGTTGPRFACVMRCSTSANCNGSSCVPYGPDDSKHCVPTSWEN